MTPLLCALLLACGTSSTPEQPPPEPDEPAAAPEAPAQPPPPPAAATSVPVEGRMGAYTARLTPGNGTLELVVLDANGAPVDAVGEASVIVSGVGTRPERVVLAASGQAWSGKAGVQGGPGHVAIVSVEVGGKRETTRLTWGK